ncbi:MAG: L-seryl-tRNA(Sec) selenium transferase [Acidobacteria bacterium]|nr:L-seryl-tRNA(Sec) selenium transferase [Acidobacteriota bacterium]
MISSSSYEPLVEDFGRSRVVEGIRRALDRVRSDGEIFDAELVRARVAGDLAARASMSLRPMINGTGVLIHTNLGRSPIDPSIWAEAARLVTSYSNLEYDIESASRGSRQIHLGRICEELFGCEAAILVNNNAAAVTLVLAALAAEREVVVSRGELVEIGGSFRVPDVIRQGGARLREVGTTNRTRAADYRDAVSGETGALLRVDASNFRIVGFTEHPSLGELIGIAGESNIPLVVDEGGGRVVDLSGYGFSREETVGEMLRMGADVVTCSTDKLIGAIQGGLILGSRELVERCRRHPLMRAFRPGKETFAIVTLTLREFLREAHEERIPIYRMMKAENAALEERGRRIVERQGLEEWKLIETKAVLGGGTTPDESIESRGLAKAGRETTVSSTLRDLGVVSRVEEGSVIVDLRTVLEEEDSDLGIALRRGEEAVS